MAFGNNRTPHQTHNNIFPVTTTIQLKKKQTLIQLKKNYGIGNRIRYIMKI